MTQTTKRVRRDFPNAFWLVVMFMLVAACKFIALCVGDLFFSSFFLVPLGAAILGYVGGIRRDPELPLAGLLVTAAGVCLADFLMAPTDWPRAGSAGSEFEWFFMYALLISIGIAIPAVALAYWLAVYIYRSRDASHRPIQACAKCGYTLRGLVEPRCPECGMEYDPTLLEENAPVDPESSVDG